MLKNILRRNQTYEKFTKQNADHSDTCVIYSTSNEQNKHYRTTNKTSNQNNYSSPTENNHHGDRCLKILLILGTRTGRHHITDESRERWFGEDRCYDHEFMMAPPIAYDHGWRR